VPKFSPGEIIRFTYHSHLGIKPDEPKDDFKEVLVLHPGWQGKVHAIDLKRLTMAEREVLDAVFDPKTKEHPHRMPLVNDIVRRMDPIEEIKNPVSFYSKFVRVFLRNKDAYRTYEPRRMLSVTVVKGTAVTGKVINPNPLFSKIESKPTQPTKPEETTKTVSSQDRLALLKKRAELQKK
jgi:hypothetical protein